MDRNLIHSSNKTNSSFPLRNASAADLWTSLCWKDNLCHLWSEGRKLGLYCAAANLCWWNLRGRKEPVSCAQKAFYSNKKNNSRPHFGSIVCLSCWPPFQEREGFSAPLLLSCPEFTSAAVSASDRRSCRIPREQKVKVCGAKCWCGGCRRLPNRPAAEDPAFRESSYEITLDLFQS